MCKSYLLLATLLLCSQGFASNSQKHIEQSQNVTRWHAVYQATLKNSASSALNLLQNRYHTATYDDEKLYVSGLIYEYMANRQQPYYGNSQGLNTRFAQIEHDYISALIERKQGHYDASFRGFFALRNLMKKESNVDGEALMDYQLCYTLNQQGRYQKAHFFCSALERHVETRKREGFPTDIALRIIANNYNFRGENDKSLRVYQRLLESMPEQIDPSGVYNDVGNLLAEIGQFEQSEQYLIQALLARQANATPLQVAQVEHSLAAMHAKAKDFNSAVNHYQNSLRLLDQVEYPYGEGLVYLGLASALIETGKREQGITYINAALELGERHENNHLQTEAHLAAGLALLESDPDTAITHGDSALELATDNGRPLLQAKAQLLLSRAHQSQKHYQTALAHYKAYSTLELANRDTNNIRAIEALDLTKSEYEYELELARINNERSLKQSELEKLTAQKQTYSFTVVFLVILLVLAIMLQRQTTRQARLDSLTCALNRSTTIAAIKSQTTKADNNMQYVLALFDLDDFKSINNTFGCPAGDLVLQQVCQALNTQLSEGEYIGRLSGDEFIVLLKNIDEIDVPFRVQSLHSAISEVKVKTDGNEGISITASLAYLATSDPLTHFDALYGSLNQRLNEAKSSRQNVIIDVLNESTHMSLAS